MQVTGPSNARPAWYDRTPLDASQGYVAGGVAPHANTTRWSYTVPANRKALVEGSSILVIRDAAATGIGNVDANVNHQPLGASGFRINNAIFINVAVDTNRLSNYGATMLLRATDILTGATSDSSTGGTVLYRVAAKVTEFDA